MATVHSCLGVAFHCVYVYHIFVHSSVHGWVGCHIGTVVSNAALNTGVHVSFQVRSLGLFWMTGAISLCLYTFECVICMYLGVRVYGGLNSC